VLTSWSPASGDDIRVDSAVEQGDTVPSYDGLLATLAVHAPTPRAAVARLHAARERWVVEGVALVQGVRSGV
jgi:acetyl/propionyl-CoA carboxylase alpha subunit